MRVAVGVVGAFAGLALARRLNFCFFSNSPTTVWLKLGRAVPYGIYDLAANAGWVAVGVDNETAAFAVQTIRRWWREVGQIRYPLARRLVITADGGGSNGSRVRLWKLELQRVADELGISIEVHHLPPGTSKWNKIEHRLFSFIPQTGAPNRWSAIASSSN